MVENRESKEKISKIGDKVFIGGGGECIGLLEKCGVKEREEVGGLGMSGELLRCRNGDIIKEDAGKV